MDGMTIELSVPDVDELTAAALALREWQHDGSPVQLHPGDLGWHWRFGAERTIAIVRTWLRDGEVLALGMADGVGLVRMAIAPSAQGDEELARQLVADLTRPERGVLPHGEASVEARAGELFRSLLVEAGWVEGESWTPLERDLAEPVEDCGIRIEVVQPGRTASRVEVQRAAFETSTFTEERWQAMAEGPLYADARCLVGYDDHDIAVAAVTVWSAGPGRPGLLEPLGVHRDHRGHGYGRAISVAAAAALRELGASTATVCTPSANLGGVATYRAAGFQQGPDARDLRRDA